MSMDMFDGMFDSPEGAVPQNPLADLVEGHGLQGALHSALPSGLGDGLGDGLSDGLGGGLTVEFKGREYFVDALNVHDPNVHNPNRGADTGVDGTGRGWGGVEESVTIADDRGMSILSDTDGDGKVDYVSTVSYDGQWSAWRWIEPGEAEGASLRNNKNTPDTGGGQWETDAWKCVDRGEWG
ncbi:DUF6802 family protein [Corynebacterium macclintockiae]|uniref:DUF6802 family protein n=1 Tax=Corynebacterium macclintockiae TaxID=2913501 RepID=UPI003EBB4752